MQVKILAAMEQRIETFLLRQCLFCAKLILAVLKTYI